MENDDLPTVIANFIDNVVLPAGEPQMPPSMIRWWCEQIHSKAWTFGRAKHVYKETQDLTKWLMAGAKP